MEEIIDHFVSEAITKHAFFVRLRGTSLEGKDVAMIKYDECLRELGEIFQEEPMGKTPPALTSLCYNQLSTWQMRTFRKYFIENDPN